MMKILLTGGTGLVGKTLLSSGYFDSHIVKAPSSSEVNLLDYQAISDYIKYYVPDLIIHAAGKVGGIQQNLSYPVEFYYQNIQMGNNLVHSAFKSGIKKLINLGSSCMYPKDQLEPLRESQILTNSLEPSNEGYALAKIAIQRLCSYISSQYPDFAYKTLIPCNLYGPFDNFSPVSSHLIASIISKLDSAISNNHSSVEIWGDGSARREFMYAGDLADAISFFTTHFDLLPSLMNIGFGVDYSINQFYHHAASVIGYKGTFHYNLDRPSGMKKKLLDISMQKQFGWSPRTSLNDGLTLTYNSYINR